MSWETSSVRSCSLTIADEATNDDAVLFISVILIWKIRTTLKQKLALTFTLCLTIVMIIFTISRIGGLRWKGKLDSVWQNLFITIMAEIGLSLVAVSAFRALYVAKSKERHVNKAITSFGWYDKGRSAAWRVITKTTGKVPSTSTDTKDRGNATLQNDIPRGIMTGMRTFVDEHGRTKMYDTMDEEMSVDYASSREPKRSTISSV